MTRLKYILVLTFVEFAAALYFQKAYPDTELKRVYVSEARRPWNKEWNDYAPLQYSSPCSDISVCDPDIGTPGFNPQFNEVDGSIDRRRPKSVVTRKEKNYQVRDGYPLNPYGRTGMRGRGNLPRWGPNYLLCVILRRGTKPIEYAMLERNSTVAGIPVFPEYFMDNPKRDVFPPAVLKVLRDKLSSRYNVKYVDDIINRTIRKKREHWSGFYPDQRNTDNAWIEYLIFEFEDRDYAGFGMADLKADNNELGLTWNVSDAKFLHERLKYILRHSKSSFLATIPRRVLLEHLAKRSDKLGYILWLLRIIIPLTSIGLGVVSFL